MMVALVVVVVLLLSHSNANLSYQGNKSFKSSVFAAVIQGCDISRGSSIDSASGSEFDSCFMVKICTELLEGYSVSRYPNNEISNHFLVTEMNGKEKQKIIVIQII